MNKFAINSRLYGITAIFLFSLMFCMGDVNAYTPQNGLVAYYEFNSSVGGYTPNSKGGQLNLTAQALVIFNESSHLGNASWVIENVNGQIYQETRNNSFNLEKGNVTLNIWIYPKIRGTVFDYWNGVAIDYWRIFINNSGPNAGKLNSSGLCEGESINTTVINNTWTMLTFISNDSSILLYKNGVYESQCGRLNTDDIDDFFYMGFIGVSNKEYYTGAWDEFGVWNRTLSNIEVLELYDDTLTIVNNVSYNLTTFETSKEGFYINITYDTALYSSVSANIVYNGTSYSTTKTESGNNVIFTANRNNPTISGYGIFPFYWQFTLANILGGNSYSNSSLYNQTVNSTSFANCNASLTTSYLNISFKDETTSNPLMANITSSSFSWWLGDGTYNRTYSYTNITGGSYSYPFCFFPDYKNISLELTLYYSASGYPQRSWSYNNIFNNNTYNKTLLLLGSAAGQDVTFQVVDSASYPISGVTANATKVSTGTLVASGTTGDDGGVTFFLDPNYQHTFTFVKEGYTTTSTTINPTQTSYTIHMTSTTATSNESNDYYRDISFQIAPVASYLDNRTDYIFNFTIETGYWTIQSFGFTLWNETLAIGSKSSAANGGTVSITNNTANYTRLTMRYYYVINGTYMNGTATWIILDTSGSEWSIKIFFADLKSYIATGMFGLDNFGLALLTFFSIFIIAGIMSWKYGLTSPAAIMGIIFALTLFFDVGLGIIPYPAWIDSSIPVATIFIGILFAGVLFREVTR